MNKIKIATVLLALVLFISQCKNKKQEMLKGVWRVEEVNLNGTIMDATSFGKWQWEFNEAGGYMVNMSGAKGKGTYSLKDNMLTMESATLKERPKTVYNITLLEEKQLELTSTEKLENKSVLRFVKTEGEEGEDE